MKKRNTLAGLVALAAGAAVGAGLEELLYRRLFRRADPEAREPIGSVPGDSAWVETFDGALIHCRTYGPVEAPITLVLAHGVWESHVIWHYQVRDLVAEGDVRIVAYDARGHGDSGPVRGPDGRTPFTEYTLARDLVAVVCQSTSGRVVLVGHSLGGMTVQALWQHGEIKPIRERVSGAVLTNTTYTADIRGWRGGGSMGERAFERFEDVLQQIPLTPRTVRRIRPRRGSDLPVFIARLVYGRDPSPHHIATSVRIYEALQAETLAAAVDLARFDAYHALPLIDVPVLVVTGTKDIITPPWLSEEMAVRIPEAELVVFEGCGHMSPLERYDEVTELLRKFCDRISDASEASAADAKRGGSGGRRAPGRP